MSNKNRIGRMNMVTTKYVGRLGLRKGDVIEMTINSDGKPAISAVGYFLECRRGQLTYSSNSTFPEFRIDLDRIRKIIQR